MKRKPKLKAGELRAYYGPDDDGEIDLVFAWGEGCSRRDGAMLHWCWATDRLNYRGETDPSFVKELEARGYDITTLRFSIQKKSNTN